MFKKMLLGFVFLLISNSLVFADFVNIKDKYEIDLDGLDYYAHTTGSENIVISENTKWVLLQQQTGVWADGSLRYQIFKLNLETGDKIFIPEEYKVNHSVSLIGISDDGDKIVYKKNLGQGYGNYYLYTFSNNQEINILLGPNENSPDRQSYFGSINKQFDKFTVMSIARNWGGTQYGHFYYRDLLLNETKQIDITHDGVEANSDAGANIIPISRTAIVLNNDFIVYNSGASNIVENDTNEKIDMFIYDIAKNTTERIDISGITSEEINDYFPIIWQYNEKFVYFVMMKDLGIISGFYSYNIETKTVEEYANSTFGGYRTYISKNGNRILYFTYSSEDGYIYRLYDKTLNKDIVVHKGSYSNSFLNTMTVRDNKVIFFDEKKVIVITPNFNEKTTYGTVTSPYTGRVWLDRNLGASRVCTAYNDEQCYGDYYQWGRNADGHEKASSDTTSTQATDVNNAGSSFITTATDWVDTDEYGALRAKNWSAIDGSSICPIGFRVPTENEFSEETINQGVKSVNSLFNSFLILPKSGARYSDGIVRSDSFTWYWTNKPYPSNYESYDFFFYTDEDAQIYHNPRHMGLNIRCIKDITSSNNPPTSKAPQDQTITEGQTVTLSASESNDTDGQIVSYEWKEGNTVLSTDENFTKSDFSVGTHTIVLTVTDDAVASASDEVVITVEESPVWQPIVKDNYPVPKDRLFTKNFQISQKNYETTSEDNLEVTLEGTSDIKIVIQKKDSHGDDLYQTKYTFVGNISETTVATLHVVDNTQGYDVSIPVTFDVSEYSITDVMPSQPFIIANGDDITYPFNVVFDVKVPAGSGVLPTCQITIPFDGSMRTIDLDVTLLEGKTDRYKCRTHTNYQDGYYLSALAALDEVDVSLGVNDQTKAYKVIKTPIFSRDALTAKATLEYLFEYEDRIAPYVKYPVYVIVNQRIYRPNTIGFPKVIYLGGENAPVGVRKFNKDTVFMQGGIWRLSYMGHSIIIELSEYGRNTSNLAFTVDGTQDLTQYEDVVKFITNPDSFYHMLVSAKISDNAMPLLQSLMSGSLLYGTGETQMSIAIKECENMSDPLTVAEALNYTSHPCVTNKDEDYNFNYTSVAVRGTTLEIHKEKGKMIAFNLLEGEVEMSATSLEQNITLYDMQGFAMGDTSKHIIESTMLTPIQESYLAEHSLSTADENTTVGSIILETNVDNASYLLIGDQVQAGHGKQTVFERVAEGSYSMVYLPVSGYIEPNPKVVKINEESIDFTLTDIYREAVTTEYNTTSYYIAYDKNDTRQYALVMPSSQKIYTHEAGDIMHLNRVDTQFDTFPVYDKGRLCFPELSGDAAVSSGAGVMAEQCYEVKFFYTQKERIDNGTAFMLYYKPADKLYEGIAGDASSFKVVKEGSRITNTNSITGEDYSHFRFDTAGAMAEIKTFKEEL